MIRGCIPVLVTPYNEDRSIDFDAYERMLERLKDQGASALWVLGTGAEDMAIPFDKRLAIVEFLATNFSKDFRILVGVSFFAFEETLRFVSAIRGMNIDSIHYMPYQPLIGLDQLRQNYEYLASIAEKRVWLYTSGNWTRHIPPDFLEFFSENDAFAGCKYSTSNIVNMEQALSYQSDRFQVLPAVVKQALPSLALGAVAFTTVEAMIHLPRVNRIVSAFEAGDLQTARIEQRTLNALLSKLTTEAGRQNFLKTAEIKGIMSKMDLCQKWVSNGLMDVTEQEAEKLYQVFAASDQ